MLLAARLLADRGSHVVLPDVVCTLLYVVAIIATIVAFVGLLMSLFSVGGARWGGAPGIIVNWWYAAAVALIAWLLYVFLC